MPAVLQKRGGPYPQTTAGIGGRPSVIPDVPVCAVFILLYILFAATNATIFAKNRHRRRKFLLTVLLIGFSWARVATLVLRIAWATRQKNARLALAAQILLNAGVLIVYIINYVLAQRILRSRHPILGWHPVSRMVSKMLYALIGLALAGVIASVVISAYTLSEHTRTVCRDVQLACLTYFLVFTALPLVQIAVSFLPSNGKREDPFGEGSMASKILIVTCSTLLCVLIAGFKAGATWSPPRPASNPPWYDSKASLYVFDFALEILTLCVLTLPRIDRRFFVTNGSKHPGDYSRAREVESRDTRSETDKKETESKETVNKEVDD